MSEHLRVIFGAPERLDPLGGMQMLARAIRSRDLSIGDVADEHVLERVLDLTFDGAAPRALHQLLLAERM